MTDSEVSNHRLVGGWRLARWVAIADDGSETFPMGEAPDGLLDYSADGTMVTIMSRGDRVRFAGDDVTGGSEAERASAFASCIAYGGRYEVSEDTVIHQVETSLFPNWVGTEQGSDTRPALCGSSANVKEKGGQMVKDTDKKAQYRRVEIWIVPSGAEMPAGISGLKAAPMADVQKIGCPK